MRATISSKGQVTIPKRLRDRLGLREGVVIDFREAGGQLIAERVAVDDPVAAAYGILAGSGVRSDDLLRELRGDERP